MGASPSMQERNQHQHEDIKGAFKTKDTLTDENMKITKVVTDLDRRYKDLYKHVEALARAYGHCKRHLALIRYKELKNMIKECISEEVMQKATTYSAAETPQEHNTTSLVEAARGFKDAAEAVNKEAAARDELARLHKAEIAADLEQKKKLKDKEEMKFRHLQDCLVKLRHDYQESKQHKPVRRYLLMKEMIKLIIRDDALKIDNLDTVKPL